MISISTNHLKPNKAQHLSAVLRRLQKAGLTLNDKCEFFKDKIRFLGLMPDGARVRPDPEKVQVITQMKEPQSVSKGHGFIGTVTHQEKFLPHLALKSKSL